MADQKATALSAFTPVLSDILYGVDDPGGTPVSGKMTLTAVRDLLQANLTTALTGAGTNSAPSYSFSGDPDTGFYNVAGNNVGVAVGGIEKFRFGSAGDFTLSGGLQIGGSTAVPETTVASDGAHTLALRKTTNAQTFNIYNTFTDASNYERGGFKWNTNVLEVFAEAAGTGTARAIDLSVAGTTRLRITTSGHMAITSGRRLYFGGPAESGPNLHALSSQLRLEGGALEFLEQAAPANGPADSARLYAKDNGSGKTQLVVIFSSGVEQVLATEP